MNYCTNEPNMKDIVLCALKEDIGIKDITTQAFIPKDKLIKAVILVKEDCVVCGLRVAALTFHSLDKKIKFMPLVSEGSLVKRGKIIARISGKAKSILTAERVALNFLSFLCGISTKTKRFIEAIKPYKAKIMDTRKTIPGLRDLEKYAVRIGGGYNHRIRLDEMLLIKDNHLKVIKGCQGLPQLSKVSHGFQTEIEVKNLKEFKAALKLKPDIIMLDNMRVKDISKAIKIRNNLSPKTYRLTPKLEASGGITMKNVKQIASTGVEMISVGALTHSVSSIDISLEIL